MEALLKITKQLNAGKHHSIRNDDVFVDRLNHRYTVTMILCFAVIVTTTQYFGVPIFCWVPAQFKDHYVVYTNNICWVMSTYYIPMELDIPHAEPTRYERVLKYYQWSAFILLFMALGFYMPRMLWRSLSNRSGLDIEKLVEMAMKLETVDDRKKNVKAIVDAMTVYIENRYTSSNHPWWYHLVFWRRRHLSSYLVALFTCTKFLFLLNSFAQFFLLNRFLGNDYHLFGLEVLSKFVSGLDWTESKRFPRVTLCDFHIREIGIVHRYTVQCVLPINLFNEKIFLVLWFWILFLVAMNLVNFLAWLLRTIRVGGRSAYVRRKLAMSGGFAKRPTDDRQAVLDKDLLIRSFVRDYLQADGCFALRLLARNGQDIVVGEVIEQLFKRYRRDNDGERLNTDRADV